MAERQKVTVPFGAKTSVAEVVNEGGRCVVAGVAAAARAEPSAACPPRRAPEVGFIRIEAGRLQWPIEDELLSGFTAFLRSLAHGPGRVENWPRRLEKALRRSGLVPQQSGGTIESSLGSPHLLVTWPARATHSQRPLRKFGRQHHAAGRFSFPVVFLPQSPRRDKSDFLAARNTGSAASPRLSFCPPRDILFSNQANRIASRGVNNTYTDRIFCNSPMAGLVWRPENARVLD